MEPSSEDSPKRAKENDKPWWRCECGAAVRVVNAELLLTECKKCGKWASGYTAAQLARLMPVWTMKPNGN